MFSFFFALWLAAIGQGTKNFPSGLDWVCKLWIGKQVFYYFIIFFFRLCF